MDLQELEDALLYAEELGIELELSDGHMFRYLARMGEMLRNWGPPPGCECPDDEPF